MQRYAEKAPAAKPRTGRTTITVCELFSLPAMSQEEKTCEKKNEAIW